MKRWRSRTVLLGVLVLGLVLMMVVMASCGEETTTTSQGEAATTPGEAPQTKFTVALTAEDLYSFFEPRVAVTEGFFADRGLDVELVVVDSTEGAITAFAAGHVNIIDGDPGAYLRAAALGQFNPVMFYARDDSGVFDIMVPEGSPIQSEADLEGKVIGVNADDDPGMSLILALEPVLGIKVESQIVGDPLGAIAGLDRGDIDAYAGADGDFAVILNRDMAMRSIVPASIKGINGGDGYWALQETMDADPAAFRAFVEGLQEARAWIGNDQQKLVDWANSVEPIAEEDMDLNNALATMVLQMRPPLSDISPYGYIVPELWQTWWDNLVMLEIIDPSVGEPTEFYTNEFFDM